MSDGRASRLPAAVFMIVAALAPGAPARAGGAIIDVPGDHTTIQAAIDAASDGDTVVVAPGIYTGVGNRDLDFGGRRITVRSSDPEDPSIVGSTIIDCLQAGRGFFFHTGETPESVVDGLTVTNGFDVHGAGVYLLDGSGATIRNCQFHSNTVPSSSGVIQSGPTPERATLVIEDCGIVGNTGGGVAIYSLDTLDIRGTTIASNTSHALFMFTPGALTTVIRDCVVTGNQAGGLFLRGDLIEVSGCLVSDNQGGTGLSATGFFGGEAVEIFNCTISGNTSAVGTGGLTCQSDSTATIRNCQVTGNTGRTAGGISLSGFGAFEVTGCTVTGNTSTDFGGGGIHAFGTDPTAIENCILWGNTGTPGAQLLLDSGFNNPAIVSVRFCDVQGGAAGVSVDTGPDTPSQLIFGPGNIDADPLFVDQGAGDYHLAAGSPAVDAGDPEFVGGKGETDLDGDPRVVGARVDLGSDELRRPGDLDGDGTIGIVDLLALLSAWGPCAGPPEACPADLDGDGAVGILDLLMVLSDWG